MSCLKSSALIAVGATRDSTSAMMWPSTRLVPKLATRRVLCDETKPEWALLALRRASHCGSMEPLRPVRCRPTGEVQALTAPLFGS
jgi:hypothetical protein